MPGWGLGKKRTRLGTFLDINGLTQRWLQKESGLSEETIRRLTNMDVAPNYKTMKKILNAIRKIDPAVKQDDFWSM